MGKWAHQASVRDNAHASKGYRYARRAHYLRTLGFAASALPISALRWEEHLPISSVAFCVVFCLAWPHIAWFLGMRAPTPLEGQRRNLILDSVLGGFFVALMRFAPIPTFAASLIFAVNSMAGGGLGGFLSAVAAMSIGALAGWLVTGGALFHGDVLVGARWWLPLLTIYTLLVAHLAYETAVKLADRSRRLREIGRKDPLTGLLNRQTLIDELKLELARSNESGVGVTLFYIDLDGFKAVNDSYGHSSGDSLLVEMAARISSVSQECAAIGRLGGDEFMVVASLASHAARDDIAQRLLEQIARPVSLGGRLVVDVTCSIGSSESPRDGSDLATLVLKADAAMYTAKRAGRNRYQAYDERIATSAVSASEQPSMQEA